MGGEENPLFSQLLDEKQSLECLKSIRTPSILFLLRNVTKQNPAPTKLHMINEENLSQSHQSNHIIWLPTHLSWSPPDP